MFKDRKEELRRLEEELLLEAEIEQQEALLQQELDEAEALLDDPDDFGEETEETYYNYSNGYGEALGGYGQDFDAYNTDFSDEDLESYSEEVYRGHTGSGNRGLVILAVCLTVAILGVIAWCALRFSGVLG